VQDPDDYFSDDSEPEHPEANPNEVYKVESAIPEEQKQAARNLKLDPLIDGDEEIRALCRAGIKEEVNMNDYYCSQRVLEKIVGEVPRRGFYKNMQDLKKELNRVLYDVGNISLDLDFMGLEAHMPYYRAKSLACIVASINHSSGGLRYKTTMQYLKWYHRCSGLQLQVIIDRVLSSGLLPLDLTRPLFCTPNDDGSHQWWGLELFHVWTGDDIRHLR